MPAARFEIMEWLWEELDKAPDPEHITYVLDDIDALWHLGFVDTEAYPLATWRAAFDPHKQGDDTYHLNQADFLAKEPYRYKGEIHIPFNAMEINEGKYTDQGFQELVDLSIAPSCRLSKAELHQFVEELKTEFREKDGLIRIEKLAKLKIRDLINHYPSPLRNLEILYAGAVLKLDVTQLSALPGTIPPATAEQVAEIQKSTFSMLATTKAEKSAKQLKNLTKSQEKRATPAKSTEVSLKQIKRNPKGIRS